MRLNVSRICLRVIADTVAGYINALLNGAEFKRTIYAFDRRARHKATVRFLERQRDPEDDPAEQAA